MFIKNKGNQTLITGDYFKLYKDVKYHLSYDLPNEKQRKLALTGIKELLFAAQKEGRNPETIFGESKDTFYQELLSAFPDRIGVYDLKKIEHKKSLILRIISIVLISAILLYVNIYNGVIPLYIFGYSWYEESGDYYKYTSQTKSSNIVNIDLANLDNNNNMVLYDDGKCIMKIDYVYLNNLGEHIIHVSTLGRSNAQVGRLVTIITDINNNPDKFLPYVASKIESTFQGKSYESPIRTYGTNWHRNGEDFEFALFNHGMYLDGKLNIDGKEIKSGIVSVKIYHLLEITWKRK